MRHGSGQVRPSQPVRDHRHHPNLVLLSSRQIWTFACLTRLPGTAERNGKRHRAAGTPGPRCSALGYTFGMEIGIYTFAERTPDPATGATIGEGQRLRDLLEQVELADQVGLDVYGVG